MTKTAARRIGLLVGGGRLPVELAETLSERGEPPHILALAGLAAPELSRFPYEEVNWGGVGHMVRSFREAGCTHLVLAGSVRRPDLSRLRPDLGFFKALPKLIRIVRAGGDDAVLRAVAGFFADKGLTIIGAADIAPQLLVQSGCATQTASPSVEDIALAQRAFEAIAALSPYDVGQGVIISPRGIEAIEGAEGTDAMMARTAEARRTRAGSAPVAREGLLVKRPKVGQDLRLDLPAVGPRTALNAAEARLAGIVVEPRRVLALDRQRLVYEAERNEVFVFGLEPREPGGHHPPGGLTGQGARKGLAQFDIRSAGRRRIPERSRRDLTKAAGVSAAMEPFGCGEIVVCSSGYVSAVSAMETPVATIVRAGQLVQWGGGRLKRRTGVVVLSAAKDVTPDCLEAAASAGLAGLAVRPRKFSAPLRDDIAELANRKGLFVAMLYPAGSR